METYTDMPGMQFFTPAWARGPMASFAGVCFETQFFPTAINCPSYLADFPAPVTRGGETFESDTIFRFSVE